MAALISKAAGQNSGCNYDAGCWNFNASLHAR
jgi:hypothetical protein